MNAFLPLRIVFLLRLTLLNFSIFFTLRLIFCFAYIPDDMVVKSFSDFAHAFYLGGKFDLRFTLLSITPFLLFSRIRFLDPLKNKKGKLFWSSFFTLSMGLVLIFYTIDFGTYSYLYTRVNSTILKFLKNPLISFRMVWESYHVLWIAFGLLVSLFLYRIIVLKKVFVKRTAIEVGEGYWKKSFVLWMLTICLWVGGIYGKFAYYPLRWSEAFFTNNSFISYLSLNPILFFFDSYKFTDRNYDIFQTKKYYPVVSDYLGIKNPSVDKLNYKRTINPHRVLSGQPNVVVIVMESLAAFKTGIFGNKLNPTPYFDQLSKESLLFNRFYVPSQATARSIFGVVTGIPDVSQSKTGSRNPYMVNQNSVANALDGHEKLYFLGGSANWGNIRSVFTHNIDGIKVFEEGDYNSPRTDVWGLSDYHLFSEANRVLREKKSPFFAFIQSSSFHRPYSIPEDKEGFERVSFKGQSDSLKKYGFISEDEFNSMRFQDYSLGHFFELAKKEAYYKDTVFFIFGDHGLPGSGGKNIPIGEKASGLPSFHVPFLIHGPKYFSAGVDNRFVSELDVFPTIAGLLGKPFENFSLGRNIFDPQFDDKRQVFTFRWYARPPRYGILEKDFFYEETLGKEGNLTRYSDKKNYDKDMRSKYPEKFEQLKNLARGMYQTSKFMLFNNKRGILEKKGK